MSASAWILAGGFAGLLIIGAPFWFALAATSLIALFASDIDSVVLAQKFIGGTQSFSLLAIPFFLLAGELMASGGLSRRLIEVGR